MKRYTAAIEILRTLESHASGKTASFYWHRAWLVRRDLVLNALFNFKSPLLKIPGFRHTHLRGLAIDGLISAPFDISTSVDAVQVGEKGTRLRSFSCADKTTLKVVREDSHYGPSTLNEIKLRSEISTLGILAPRMDGHGRKNGFITLREELVEGRCFNKWRDKNIFCSHIIDPLINFYERYGITMLPLSEALGPMTSFVTEEISPRIFRLLNENPQVAVSMCHNDVLPSNLAVTPRGVYFLDWGSAIMSLCGRDFVRMGEDGYLEGAAISEYMQAKISHLQRGKMGLEDMLAVQKLWRRYAASKGDPRIDTSAFMPPSALDRTG